MKALIRMAALGIILAVGIAPAHASPYHWCANDGQSRSGGLFCYYETLNQCKAAISGSGAFCVPNYSDPEPPGHAPTRRRR